MSALHVVVRPQGKRIPHPALAALGALIHEHQDASAWGAELDDSQVSSLLVEVALAAAAAFTGPDARQSVPFDLGSECWELGLQARERSVLLSLFRQGPIPEVRVFKRAVAGKLLVATLKACLEEFQASSEGQAGQAATFALARAALSQIKGSRRPAPLDAYRAESKHKSVRLRADFSLMRGDVAAGSDGTRLERADLHALLATGDLSLSCARQTLLLRGSQVFLDAERLLNLAAELLDAWRGLAPTFRRTHLSQAKITLRRGAGESPVDVRLHSVSGDPAPQLVCQLPTRAFIESVAEFCLSVCSAFTQNEAAQAHNLRLSTLERDARSIVEQCATLGGDESRLNPHPDSYRRFVPRLRRTRGVWDSGGKMRFAARWVASMPAIDLQGTFLCGDHVMVGGANETACLDRRSGAVLWKQALPAAACVVTPSGLVRIEPDGLLSCHDLSTGMARFTQRIAPRPSGRASGSVLHGPGLPRLLALAEGDRQVSGIDLTSGEVRWRYTARHAGNYRLRRTGRLLLVAGGAPVIVALDAVTGQVVWKLGSRMPFGGDLAVDRESAYALSGGQCGNWQLHQLDPFTGEAGWTVQLTQRPMPGRAPLLTPRAVIVVTLDDEGVGAQGFDRATGRLLWEQPAGLAAQTTAFLAVDDCIVANSAAGVLLGLDGHSGQVRYSHVFSAPLDGDQPRRLEPVLRNGALFVPQSQVHVVRPRDGELLGSLPSDLVPDLIRVDEHCHVYVAEESGHLAAFGAAPRLALVS